MSDAPKTPEMIEAEARQEVAMKLASQAWRLNNLYWIQDQDGKKVKFKPRWEQRELHNNFHDLNAVLKCRQPGISTYIALLVLDFSLFTKDKTSGVVDKTDPDAVRKLEKIKFAYDNLDSTDKPECSDGTLTENTAAIGALLKSTVFVKKKNDHEFAFSNGSQIWAGTGMRGGTLQFLWITEMGYTSFYFPEKAKEIKKGALNTVHAGNRVVIETTHEGGKFGEWYSIAKLAQEAPNPLTPLDWKFHFFAWHKHSAYTFDPPADWAPDKEHADYFDSLAKEGIKLTRGQQFWYVKKHASIGESIKSEFPSTPEEAFTAVIKGAIYGKNISALRAKRRIVDFDHDPALPIYTFWDIGYSDFTSIWLLQFAARDVYALNYRCNCRELPAYYVAIVREWEQRYGTPVAMNFLPHDADHKEFGGKSAKDHLMAAKLGPITVVPVIRDQWTGINHLRAQLPRFIFHKTDCDKAWSHDGQDMPSGVACLEAYHTREDASSGVIRDVPVHDANSHGADALRTFAEADMRGLIVTSAPKFAQPTVIMAGWNGPRPGAPLARPRVIMNR